MTSSTSMRHLALAAQRERRPQVLLVEDDAGDRLLVRRAFSGDAVGADLCLIDDGDSALDHLLRCAAAAQGEPPARPDLVLLDLNLPGARGSQILEVARGDKRLQSMPIVVFSTSSRDRDIEESYRRGCNAYVVKPESAAGFIEVIRAVCHFWLRVVVLPHRA